EFAAVVGVEGVEGLRFGGVQQRWLRRGGAGQSDGGNDLEGALSERQDGERKRAAAGAAVFFRGVFVAGYFAAAFPESAEHVGEFFGQGGGAAQRHAPGDRGGGVDENPVGRASHELGCGVGDH